MNKNYTWFNHLLSFVGIILGVYLGFYINERGKIKGESKERVLLVTSMINDLKADIKTFEEYQIPKNKNYTKRLDSLLILLSENRVEAFNQSMVKIFQVENFTPNSSIYNSITSSGKINLLNDLQLQKKLTDFYNGTVIECVEKNRIQAEFFMDELVQWFIKNSDLTEMKIQNRENLTTLKNTILIYRSLVDQKVDHYQLIVEEAKELKERLSDLVDTD